MFIYQILNNVNKMSYVGMSAKDSFDERYRKGRWWIRSHNLLLKRSAKKYGIQNFVVNILEDNITDITQLPIQELFWITKLNTYYPNGYNFPYPTEVLENGKTYKIKNIKTNIVIEITNLTDFCRKNKLGIKAINAMVMGKTIQSHGYCRPETTVLPEKQTLKNPVIMENVLTGEIVEIKNISNFCRENKLRMGGLSRVIHKYKDRKSYKGWKLKDTMLKEKLIHKNIIFINPMGEKVFVENLCKFCKVNNICYPSMLLVAKEKYLQYKGWKLEKNKNVKRIKLGKQFDLINPDNKIIHVDSISKFCREFNVSRYLVEKLLNGIKDEYKGYKLYEL